MKLSYSEVTAIKQVLKTSKQVTQNIGFKYVVTKKSDASFLEQIQVMDLVNDKKGYSLEYVLNVADALGEKYQMVFSDEQARFMHSLMT